jgi:hypothetical protein
MKGKAGFKLTLLSNGSTCRTGTLWPVGAALVAAAVVAGAYVNAVCARPADFGADHPNYGGI